ncbi:strictosidine synthase [Naegleria gruberi]|uniref:Strictosidine synthase n=1 Tax=Naegleria gruberi TaxID=5762 RepID=D2VUF7_NAEGR|nr:strictosidine synthase [Naegleria gruberi]EFC39438.1 strictosidine synthase [Naegleria gruberi]|eukprot:XP_002672182.1 strictosidine synthase [Naegleria gruberi strain NEG-M]
MKSLLLLFTLLATAILIAGHKVTEKTIISSEKIGYGVLKGPESIVWDPVHADVLYTGINDGSIMRVNVTSGVSTVYAYSVPALNATQRAVCGTSVLYEGTCGRVLGMVFDKNNNLIVADAYKGLLRISRANPSQVEVLVNSYNGVPFKMTNSVVLLKDGKTVYFTDSSLLYSRLYFVSIVVANNPDGRLFKFDLETKQLQVVISDLKFANGIAVSKDESFLVINECSSGSLRRFYLKGRKAGTNDVFVQDIGGYADNIKTDDDGNFLVGLFSNTTQEVTAIHDSAKLKNIFLTIVPATTTLGMIVPQGLVKKVNQKGKITTVYSDKTATFALQVSEADVRGGYLYLCSVLNPWLTRVNLSTGLQ